MTSRPVNDAQLRVLTWLNDGGAGEPPAPEVKISAVAPESRGLVRIRRSRGRWSAELTDAGRYYADHGDYPPKVPRKKTQSANQPEATPAPVRDEPSDAPRDDTDAESRASDVREALRRAHPAVRELRDRPARLPAFARNRCLLISNAIVQAALDREWTVSAVEGRMVPDVWGTRHRRFDSRALLVIDAGAAPIGVLFEEVTRRRPHEDTAEEAKRRARGRQPVFTRDYDNVGTGKLRLALLDGERKLSTQYTDGARVRVEDRLEDVTGAIGEATQVARRHAEERRRWEEEQAAKRREAQRVHELRRAYDDWETQLEDRADLWARHQRIRNFLDEVQVIDEPGVDRFIEWARGHLAATDPRRGLPAGETPAWNHEQRAVRGRLKTDSATSAWDWPSTR